MHTKKLYVVCWKPRSNGTVTIVSEPMDNRKAVLKAMWDNRKFPDSPHWVEAYKGK